MAKALVADMFAARGSIMPLALAGSGTGIWMGIELDMRDEQAKDANAAMIRHLVKERPQVSIIIFIAESWRVVATKDEALDRASMPMPSKHPRREEGVLVNYEARDGSHASLWVPILRGPDRLDEPTEVEDAQMAGRFAGFFESHTEH
jgi:hypothetical protein